MAVKKNTELELRLLTPTQKKAYRAIVGERSPVSREYMYSRGFSTSVLVALRSKGLVKVLPDGTYVNAI